jgi:hypothetical protein
MSTRDIESDGSIGWQGFFLYAYPRTPSGGYCGISGLLS